MTSAIEIPDREDPGRGHLSLTATSGSPPAVSPGLPCHQRARSRLEDVQRLVHHGEAGGIPPLGVNDAIYLAATNSGNTRSRRLFMARTIKDNLDNPTLMMDLELIQDRSLPHDFLGELDLLV